MRFTGCLITALIVLSSCQITKRKYNKGYYLSFGHKSYSSAAKSNEMSKNPEPSYEFKTFAVQADSLKTVNDALVELKNKIFDTETSPRTELKPKFSGTGERVQNLHSKMYQAANEKKRQARGGKLKSMHDTGFLINVACFSAFIGLVFFGWMFNLFLAQILLLTLIFLFLFLIVSGFSFAGLVKAIKHLFSSDEERLLAIIGIVCVSLVLMMFFMMAGAMMWAL